MLIDEVYAIPVRENGRRTTFYTETLPFNPGPGVEVMGTPVRMVPDNTTPALTPEYVWTNLLLILAADNGTDFNSSTFDFLEVRNSLSSLISQGYFQHSIDDMDGDYWLMAAGDMDLAEVRFMGQEWDIITGVLNRIFERKA